MSPQLSERCALAVLVSTLLASLMGLLAWGPVGVMQRWPDSHSAGWPPLGWGNLLHAPALIAAAFGWKVSARARPRWRWVWQAFFGWVAIATLAGAVQHVLTQGSGEWLVRAAAASACALASLLFLAERLGGSWGDRRVLLAAAVAGPAAAALSLALQALHGLPDMRLLVWLELLPFLMLPLGMWNLRSAGLGGRDWLIALLLFGVAETSVWLGSLAFADAAGGEGSANVTSYAVQHLAIAAALAWLVWALRCQCLADVSAAAPTVPPVAGAAPSQRATSRSTSV